MVSEKITMSMCIKDVNALLTKAMQDHVLKAGGYDVVEVFWDGQDMSFRVTLEPKKGS